MRRRHVPAPRQPRRDRRCCRRPTRSAPSSPTSGADKRAKKIDELLDRPGYAALWATKFCDILRPSGFDGQARLHRSGRDAPLLRVAPRPAGGEHALRPVRRAHPAGHQPRGPHRARSGCRKCRRCWRRTRRKTADLKAYAGRKHARPLLAAASAAGVKGTLQVAHAFLGLRLECAQCHRHPHDVWQQDDLLSFANFFMRVEQPGRGRLRRRRSPRRPTRSSKRGEGTEATRPRSSARRPRTSRWRRTRSRSCKAEAKALNDKATALEDAGQAAQGRRRSTPAARPAFASVTSPLGKQESKQFRLLGDSEAVDRRRRTRTRARSVMAWLRQPDNPYFARAIVNRVWAHYFGRGIIDPPDHLSPFNPPSHPELLDGAVRRLRQARLRPEAAAPDDPQQPNLPAERADERRPTAPTRPTTPPSTCAGCRPRCWSMR